MLVPVSTGLRYQQASIQVGLDLVSAPSCPGTVKVRIDQSGPPVEYYDRIIMRDTLRNATLIKYYDSSFFKNNTPNL